MEGRELHRSYTQVDFGSQRRPHHHHGTGRGGGGKQGRYAHQQQTQRSKFPTQEIYRPPSLREGGTPPGKLNVHAKEFAPLGGSSLPLQSSKSTGSILSTVHNESRSKHKQAGFPLTTSRTVHAQFQQLTGRQASGEREVKPTLQSQPPVTSARKPELQRSKSTTFAAQQQSIDFSIFGKKAHTIEAAYNNPGGLRAPALLDIARLITEKAQEKRSWAESLAALSFHLIEREKQTTFIEGLINMLQYIVREKCTNGSAGDSFYFPFISYLHALYGELKPTKIDYEKNGRSAALTLLSLLVEVCVDFLRQEKLTGRKEMESLFFVVTTIGRDVESEFPREMEGLISAVRDAFLSEGASPPNRRTLLQLVELRAARWQLPARTIHYYQTYLTAP